MVRANVLGLVLPGVIAILASAACSSNDATPGGNGDDAGSGIDAAKPADASGAVDTGGGGGDDTGIDAGAADSGMGDDTGSDATGGGDATGGDASDAGPPPMCKAPLGPNEECRNGLPAPIFQQVPAGFSIDVTEVTRSQYAAWLATKPATGNQSAACQGNTTFQPEATCMVNKLVCATNCNAHPQVCVDWCDAQAYCQALGKQLCGARPDAIAQGMTVGFTDFNNAQLDQFEYTCSADGKWLYVYSDVTYDATACNTGCKAGACKTIPVASNPKCQGPQNSVAFPGVFDLNGNVAEWDGVCATADPAAQCHVRGGDMQATATTSTCDYGLNTALVPRNKPQPTVGFRCCSAQ